MLCPGVGQKEDVGVFGSLSVLMFCFCQLSFHPCVPPTATVHFIPIKAALVEHKEKFIFRV